LVLYSPSIKDGRDRLGLAQTDTDLIQLAVSEKVPLVAMYFSTFIAGFVVAYLRNWRLALVVTSVGRPSPSLLLRSSELTTATVPCMVAAGSLFAGYAKYNKLALDVTAETGNISEETISSIRTTQAFGTQRTIAALFDAKNFEVSSLFLSVVNYLT
jgi:ATP-binding cassette subfamily B (MDR/TAP) protein 1